MKITHSCGNVIDDKNKFCIHCGETLEKLPKQLETNSNLITHSCGNVVDLNENNKFCNHCGNSIDEVAITEDVKPVKQKLNTSQETIVIHPKSGLSNQSSKTRLTRDLEFKWNKKAEFSLLLLFVGSIMSLIDEDNLLFVILIMILAVFLFQRGSLVVKYKSVGKSSTPIFVGLIPFVLSIFIQESEFFLVAIYVFTLGIVVYYLQPPRYIIDNYYSGTNLSIVLLSGSVLIVLLIDILFFGILILTGTLLFYLFLSHKELDFSKASRPPGKLQEELYHSHRTKVVSLGDQRSELRVETPATSVSKAQGSIIYSKLYDFRTVDHTNIEKLIVRLNDITDDYFSEVNLRINQIVDQLTTINTMIDVSIPVKIKNIKEGTASNNEILRIRSSVDNIKNEIKTFQSVLSYISQASLNILEGDLFKPLQIKIDEINTSVPQLKVKIDDLIDNSLLQTSNKVNSTAVLVNELYSELLTEKQQREEALRIQYEKDRVEKALKDEELTTSFQLKTLISEKLISNLFAYVGVAFLVSGIIFGMIWTYTNILLPEFPEDVEASQARLGISILYIIGLSIIFIPSLLIRKIAPSLEILVKTSISGGIIFLLIPLSVQTFYFKNLNLENVSFLVIGFLLILSAFLFSYAMRSSSISIAAISASLFILFVSANEEFAPNYFISLLYMTILAITIILMNKTKIWLALVTYGFIAPATWIASREITGANTVYHPEYLALAISVAVIILSLKKQFETPQSFTQFIVSVLIFYPNVIAIQFGIQYQSNKYLDSIPGILSTVIVFCIFYALYWLYVLNEENIQLVIRVPISYSFKSEKLRFTEINTKLNWMMLISNAIIFYIAFELRNNQHLGMMIFFALFLSIMAHVAIKYDLDKLVKSSTLFMLAEAQMFYIFALEYKNAEGSGYILITGLFLLAFTLIFEMQRRYKRELSYIRGYIGINTTARIIAIFAGINFIIGGLSSYESLIILYGVIVWSILLLIPLLDKTEFDTNRGFSYIATITSLAIPFIFGMLKQSDRLEDDALEKNIFINLIFIIYIGLAYFLVYNGKIIQNRNDIRNIEHESLSKPTTRWLKEIRLGQKAYIPHIIIFSFPIVLIAYGKPYFYTHVILSTSYLSWELKQVIIALYFIIFLVSLPLFVAISKWKKTEAFGEFAGFGGYFTFLFGFIFLSAAKEFYDRITGLEGPGIRQNLVIPVEMAIYLFVLIFILSASWLMLLSRNINEYDVNKLKMIQSPKQPTEQGGQKSD